MVYSTQTLQQYPLLVSNHSPNHWRLKGLRSRRRRPAEMTSKPLIKSCAHSSKTRALPPPQPLWIQLRAQRPHLLPQALRPLHRGWPWCHHLTSPSHLGHRVSQAPYPLQDRELLQQDTPKHLQLNPELRWVTTSHRSHKHYRKIQFLYGLFFKNDTQAIFGHLPRYRPVVLLQRTGAAQSGTCQHGTFSQSSLKKQVLDK